MILMPVWIVEETEEGYRALLGSEPRLEADREWIPRDLVMSCVKSPDDEQNPRFAVMMLKGVTEEIRKKNPDLYRNVSSS